MTPLSPARIAEIKANARQRNTLSDGKVRAFVPIPADELLSLLDAAERPVAEEVEKLVKRLTDEADSFWYPGEVSDDLVEMLREAAALLCRLAQPQITEEMVERAGYRILHDALRHALVTCAGVHSSTKHLGNNPALVKILGEEIDHINVALRDARAALTAALLPTREL